MQSFPPEQLFQSRGPPGFGQVGGSTQHTPLGGAAQVLALTSSTAQEAPGQLLHGAGSVHSPATEAPTPPCSATQSFQ